MPSELDDLAFRESIFTWLGDRMRISDAFTRGDLSQFEFQGQRRRLVGTMTGIWHVKSISDAAVSILTAYAPDERRSDRTKTRSARMVCCATSTAASIRHKPTIERFAQRWRGTCRWCDPRTERSSARCRRRKRGRSTTSSSRGASSA